VIVSHIQLGSDGRFGDAKLSLQIAPSEIDF
jgi:hypothetical protein